MTLILNGTDNSATVPAVQGGTAGTSTGLYYPTTSAVGISTAGTNAVYIDASQNVGIGTSSIGSGTRLEVRAANAITDARGLLAINTTTAAATNIGGSLSFGGENGQATTPYAFGSVAGRYEGSGYLGYLQFSTTGTGGTIAERMRIDSSGNVEVFTGTAWVSSGIGPSGKQLMLGYDTTNSIGYIRSANNGTAYTPLYLDGSFIRFNIGTSTLVEAARIDSSGNLIVGGTSSIYGAGISNYGAFVVTRNKSATAGKFWNSPYVDSNNTCYVINQTNAGVYLTDGSTAWAANSDERLKDIIEPITNAANKVSTLRAVIGKYKNDAEGTRRSFLIAQDIQAVLPEAISTSKLPNSEDDTEYLGVTYTEVIPLLVAAIKEQQALITSLTARITALETP
jgi:hypothetical protein